ncbi:putative metal-binding protein [Klebsiella grimontii]|uniref:Putative metal-binding protein n=4 Tax=Klebsiella TaxID=570 RepID=A0A7H4P180_9ENTR|nr:putative metal-binding protein [Klebsiella grimontii]
MRVTDSVMISLQFQKGALKLRWRNNLLLRLVYSSGFTGGVMPSIHGHEVLQMMISSGESYTVATLEAAIIARFGKEARFHTCSAENLSAAELVAFLQKKGKFIAVDEGFNTHESKICRH